jgi:TRAP-type C4-dicarboxylate transport system permease small subunit
MRLTQTGNVGFRRRKMNDFVNIYLKLMEFLDGVACKLGIFIAGLMTVTVSLQIITRYVMKNPLPWTEELARYLMIWMVFIGASCIIKKWDNIHVDFFMSMFKKKTRAILLLIQKFLILVLLVFFFHLCFTVFSKVGIYQMTPSLRISMFWPQSGLTAGFLLMALQNIGVILDDIFKKKIFNLNKDTTNGGGVR